MLPFETYDRYIELDENKWLSVAEAIGLIERAFAPYISICQHRLEITDDYIFRFFDYLFQGFSRVDYGRAQRFISRIKAGNINEVRDLIAVTLLPEFQEGNLPGDPATYLSDISFSLLLQKLVLRIVGIGSVEIRKYADVLFGSENSNYNMGGYKLNVVSDEAIHILYQRVVNTLDLRRNLLQNKSGELEMMEFK